MNIDFCHLDDGIDTRVHAVKLTTLQENDFGLSHDKFKAECLVRYPKLENFGCDVLYRRALLLQRYVVIKCIYHPFKLYKITVIVPTSSSFLFSI